MKVVTENILATSDSTLNVWVKVKCIHYLKVDLEQKVKDIFHLKTWPRSCPPNTHVLLHHINPVQCIKKIE